jgi:hypothetical protein
MDPSHPIVKLTLWRADAVVLFDWLMRTDLNTIPIEHPARNKRLQTCSDELRSRLIWLQ